MRVGTARQDFLYPLQTIMYWQFSPYVRCSCAVRTAHAELTASHSFLLRWMARVPVRTISWIP